MRTTPKTLATDRGILLGWEIEEARTPVGFARGDAPEPSPLHTPIWLAGEGHRITLAPTGAGKTSGPVAADLLTHDGPAVVFDPTGAVFAMTAHHRRALGQKVYLLDPFHVTAHAAQHGSDSLDPLDLVGEDTPTAILDAGQIADALVIKGSIRDPHWELRAEQVIAGIALYVATHAPKEQRSLCTVHDILYSSLNALAGVLVGMESSTRHEGHLRRAASSIQSTPDKERGSIMSTAMRDIAFLAAPPIRRVVSGSSIPIADITAGAPMTIYICIPPHMLSSMRGLLRAWTNVFVTAITRRNVVPAKRTLLLLDEAAQLGGLKVILDSICLLRNYHLQVHLLYQDFGQLVAAFPYAWQTIANNCAGILGFGFRTQAISEGVATLTGYAGKELLHGKPDDIALLSLPGQRPRLILRPSVFADPALRALARENPRLANMLPAPVPMPPNRTEPTPTPIVLAGRNTVRDDR